MAVPDRFSWPPYCISCLLFLICKNLPAHSMFEVRRATSATVVPEQQGAGTWLSKRAKWDWSLQRVNFSISTVSPLKDWPSLPIQITHVMSVVSHNISRARRYTPPKCFSWHVGNKLYVQPPHTGKANTCSRIRLLKTKKLTTHWCGIFLDFLLMHYAMSLRHHDQPILGWRE